MRRLILSLKDRVALEKTQREYQKLCVEFSGEILNMLGGVEGDAKLFRNAQQELAQEIANAISRFVLAHTGRDSG